MMTSVETGARTASRPSSRKVLVVGGALVAVGALAAGVYALYPPVVTIAAVEAPLATAPQVQAAPAPSTISIPIAIPITTLRDALERAVPARESGVRPDPIGDPVRDDAFSWNFGRTPIAVAAGDGAITATTQISGTAQISGRVVLIRGDLGKLLGRLNPTNIPFSAHADISADATVTARPVVQPNWRIAPGLSASAQLREAEIPILDVTRISVRGRLQPEIDAKINALVAQLNARLANDRFLEEAAGKAWTDLCKAHPVSGPAGTDGKSQPLFLVVRPTTPHLAPLSLSADRVVTTLGLTAETRLTDSAASLDCPPLPPIAPPPAESGFRLVVPVNLSYASLSSELARQITGKSIVSEDGKLTFAVTGARLAADGDRLRVSIGFEAAEQRYFGARVRGELQLRARPALDVRQQLLTFSDVALTAESQDALNSAGFLARLVAPAAEAHLGKKGVINLAREATRAREKAEAALRTAVEKKLGGLALSKGEINALELERLEVAANGISALATARGVLALDVIEARFN